MAEAALPVAVFHAAASRSIGGGHAMRCLTLADALAEGGWRCRFASDAETVATVPHLAAGAHAIAADDDGGAAALRVFDDYRRGAGYESGFRPRSGRILVIDDLADRPHDCDALLDATLGRDPRDYESLVPKACRVLAGPAYALLRPQFAEARPRAIERRRAGGRVRRVLVNFGAVDAPGLALRALEALRRAAPDAAVDVVLGRASPHLDAVRKAAEGSDGVHVHVDVENMAELMVEADLALGAAGTASWERSCLGLTTLVAVLADNQRRVAAALAEAGAAESLGWHESISVDALANRLAALLGDEPRRRRMAENAAVICDGRGARRTQVALLPERRARDGDTVGLRLADEADEATILDWQRHPATRRFARNVAVPTADEHRVWMATRLADHSSWFTIVEHGGRPAGVLRLDRLAEAGGTPACEVSILIAPDRLRLGIGRAALALGRALVPGWEIRAFVLPDNEASRQLFAAAGYRPTGGGWLCSAPPRRVAA